MPTKVEATPARSGDGFQVSAGRGGRMDDLSLQMARMGLVIGIVGGAIIGAVFTDSWLIAGIVLGTYGVMVGGIAGMIVGLLSRDR